MKKKIFTPAVLARIPQMVANGLRVNQIAELLGASPGSVKVTCSRHKISLGKRGGPRRPRGPHKKKDNSASFVVRLAKVQLKINVDAQTLTLIALRAVREGTTIDAVASRVLEIVARDNLYDAVINDSGLV